MGFVTLMTDFGIKDGNIGVLKGVIWKIAPQTMIADLTHMIGPQNILEGAFILGRSAYYFPDGTVHVVVVDPGVGTHRRPIAAKLGSQIFVGPDNGLLTVMLERCEKVGWPVQVVHLNQSAYWLPEVSSVFHGRDIFSPVAAHLSAGIPLEQVGSLIDDPIRIDLVKPVHEGAYWRGEIIHIDHFGNLATNITREHLHGLERLAVVRLRDKEMRGLINTFGERPVGELVALFGSTGNLIISVVNGSAVDAIHAQIGDRVEIEIVDQV